MTVPEDLWYGNIRPIENFIDGNIEYKGLLRLVSKNREVLESELSPENDQLILVMLSLKTIVLAPKGDSVKVSPANT